MIQWWRRPAGSVLPGQTVEAGGIVLGLHELADDTRDFFANAARTLVDNRGPGRLNRLLRRKNSRTPTENYEVLAISSSDDLRTERMA